MSLILTNRLLFFRSRVFSLEPTAMRSLLVQVTAASKVSAWLLRSLESARAVLPSFIRLVWLRNHLRMTSYISAGQALAFFLFSRNRGVRGGETRVACGHLNLIYFSLFLPVKASLGMHPSCLSSRPIVLLLSRLTLHTSRADQIKW